MKATRKEWEDELFKHAAYFTTVRIHGVGQRTRREFRTLQEALDDAKPDARAMVYCVAGDGLSFMIPRSEWKQRLEKA